MAELSDIIIMSKQDLLDAFRETVKALKEEWKNSEMGAIGDDELLTTSAVGKMLGRTPSAVQKLMEKQMLVPVKKQQRKWLYLKKDVIRLIESGLVIPKK